jgi:hypothetical protein
METITTSEERARFELADGIWATRFADGSVRLSASRSVEITDLKFWPGKGGFTVKLAPLT